LAFRAAFKQEAALLDYCYPEVYSFKGVSHATLAEKHLSLENFLPTIHQASSGKGSSQINPSGDAFTWLD
jgi:hypothetical protein